jgi:hypothetical protein
MKKRPQTVVSGEAKILFPAPSKVTVIPNVVRKLVFIYSPQRTREQGDYAERLTSAKSLLTPVLRGENLKYQPPSQHPALAPYND